MTVDKLLEQFVLNKYTGLEKPGLDRILIKQELFGQDVKKYQKKLIYYS